MTSMEKFVYGLHSSLLVGIASIFIVLQIILAILLFNREGSTLLANCGWVVLWIAGFFGVIPILTFRMRGGVEKGKSYIHTTTLVDTGIYAVVRHPQNGVAWVLINFGIALVAQHWLVALAGGISMVFAYLDLFKEEQRCIEKFGDDYKRYMQKVPRINFLLGLIRAIQKK
jgi:protein-S-isoprenylcysteine O-methyltransferase Ste14